MTKQLPLAGVPVPERMPLVLTGEPGIDWQVDASPRPTPPGGKYAPRARELTLRERLNQAAQRRVGA